MLCHFMTETKSKKRSTVSLLVAIPVLLLVSILLLAMKVNSFFRRKPISVDDLKFPVLVFQPNGAAVFAEWDPIALVKVEENSRRTPTNGTIIIDAAFNQYTQENVQRVQEGEIKWIGRYLFPGAMRVKYKFDLKPLETSGLEALRAQLRAAPPFNDDPAEDAAMRSAAQQQTTMAGVLDALKIVKPPEPTTQPTETAPPTTEETVEPEPK